MVDDTWDIIATSANPNAIIVIWNKYRTLDSSNVTKYVVLCTDQSDPSKITAWSADGNMTEINIQNLTASSDYIIQVLAILDSLPQVSSRYKTIRASQPVVVRTSMRGKYQLF